MASAAPTGLWRDREFVTFWAGQAISRIGAQVSFLALPLVATILLRATAFQMGLLTAAGAVPALVVGLHAGALVDRHRRRPVLIAADVGRALLLGTVPLAWVLGALSLPLLYLVALVGGALTLVFDVAYQAFLPALLEREQLLEGNGKLELTRTAAALVGPALGGWLVGLLGGPLAVAVDAASYLVSAALVGRLRVRERSLGPRSPLGRIWHEIGEGVGIVLGDGRLRAVLGTRAVLSLFNAMLEAVVVLYLVRSLGLGPVLIGVVFSVGSAGFLLGALFADRVARRLGIGRSTVGGILVLGCGDLLVPLAHGPAPVAVPTVVAAELLFGLGLTVVNVNQASVRQALVPGSAQGRASATVRVVTSAAVPLGALLGGGLGGVLGLRPTLVVAALGELLAAGWVLASPLRALRTLPPLAEEIPDPEPGT
ncbi:MAG TPA: MFS transporter [Thermomicrobiaceae bacterium]|nr:MFS transporter [Thermomicrobiaceae bacterium]